MHSPSSSPARGDATSQHDETTPLLSQQRAESSSPDFNTNGEPTKFHEVPRPIFLRAMLSAAAAVVLLCLGNWMSLGPLVRLFESILCDHYYEKTFPGEGFGASAGQGIPEELCKVDEIQDGVARLFGWQNLFDSIPGIVLAIPYGMLADWKGRKIVMVLSMVGIFLQATWVLFVCYTGLPLELSWVSSVFLCIGGGPTVALSTVSTILTDVTPPEKRSTLFFYLSSATLVGALISPVIGAYLMEKKLLLPLVIALFLEFGGVLLGLTLPETVHLHQHGQLGSTTELSGTSDPDDDGETPNTWIKKARAGLREYLQQLRHSLGFLWRDKNLILVALLFLPFHTGREVVVDQDIQYISKRYHWKVANASMITSLNAGLDLFMMIVAMPVVASILLNKLHMAPGNADIWTARFTSFLMGIGMLLVSLSPVASVMILGMVISTLGNATSPLLRSMATHIAGAQEDNDTGRLFATIAIVEAAGNLLAGPVAAGLFRLGLHQAHRDGDDAWLGLPLLASAIMFFIVFIGLLFVRLRQRTNNAEPRHGRAEAQTAALLSDVD